MNDNALTIANLRQIAQGAHDGPEALRMLFDHEAPMPQNCERDLGVVAAACTMIRAYLAQEGAEPVELGFVNEHGYVSIRVGRGTMGEMIADMLNRLAPKNDKKARFGFDGTFTQQMLYVSGVVIPDPNRSLHVWWATVTHDSLIIGGRAIWDRADHS